MRFRGVCAMGVFLAAMCSGAVLGDEVGQTVSTALDVTFVSRYVWRGIPQTTRAALQSTLSLSHPNGIGLSFWASSDLKVGRITETDYTVNYVWNSGNIGMNAGFTYYAFPNTPFASTSEAFADLRFGGRLCPSVSIYYDVDEARGFYATLGVGRAWPLSRAEIRSASLNVSGKLSFSSAAYNHFWFGLDQAALSDLSLGAGVSVDLGSHTSLQTSLAYSAVTDGAIRRVLRSAGLDPNNLVVSITLSR